MAHVACQHGPAEIVGVALASNNNRIVVDCGEKSLSGTSPVKHEIRSQVEPVFEREHLEQPLLGQEPDPPDILSDGPHLSFGRRFSAAHWRSQNTFDESLPAHEDQFPIPRLLGPRWTLTHGYANSRPNDRWVVEWKSTCLISGFVCALQE